MTDLLPNLTAAVIYAVLGIVIYVLGFAVLDRLTPAPIWKEILEEHNTALAVLVGAMSIGLSIVIAAAIY